MHCGGLLRPATVRSLLAAARGRLWSVGMLAPAAVMNLLARNLQQAAPFSTQPVSNKGHAAVLVPLFSDSQGDVHVVLTQRSKKLPTHSGEVCLPGGKREPSDPDDVATALREANEELGIDPACVNIVGRLPCFLSKHLLSVTPVVGFIPPDLRFCPNAAEVESVFSAPLSMFLEAGPSHYTRDVEWQAGMPYRLHYWRYSYLGQEYLIWGLTAGILIVVAERAFGCKAAFDISPPGARPYTDLCFDGTRLGYRSTSGTAAAAAAAAAAAGERLLAQPLGAALAQRASLEQQQAQQGLRAALLGTAAYHTGTSGGASSKAGSAGGAGGTAGQERGHWVENDDGSDQEQAFAP